MKRKRNFPYNKNDDSTGAKAPGEKSRNKNNGRKHHHVVPVKNAAGRAAAVFHKPNPERAPEKNADKVADIKNNGKQKQNFAVDEPGKINDSDSNGEQKPYNSDFNGVAVAFFYVCEKIFEVADIFYLSRNKILDAEF